MQFEEYTLEKKHKVLMNVGFVFFIALLILGLSLPFFERECQNLSTNVVWLTVLCSLIFGSLSFLCFKKMKMLPYVDICSDEEGLWYKHLQKNAALVPWSSISKIKERAFSQCLDIFDRNGEKRIQIEYQLTNFEKLRVVIANKLLSNFKEATLPSSLTKGIGYHLFSWIIIILFLFLGLYVGKDGSPILGYIVAPIMVSFIILEYVTTAYKLNLKMIVLKLYSLFQQSLCNTSISKVSI